MWILVYEPFQSKAMNGKGGERQVEFFPRCFFRSALPPSVAGKINNACGSCCVDCIIGGGV